MRIKLERFAYSPMGTFGRLSAASFSCFTVERPWADNVPYESCIPCGLYPMRLGEYSRGNPPYPDYELEKVPGRSAIEIHRGNTMDDLLGCIAPGMALGWINGKWAVTSSRLALNAFMDVMRDDPMPEIEISATPFRIGD